MKISKSPLLLLLILFFAQQAFSQIVIEETKKPKKEKKVDTLKVDIPSTSRIYFVANISRNYRLLKENKEPYGDTLGLRALETHLNSWSFGVGIQNDINEFLSWDGGISYLRNGEQYNFESDDSTYSYQTQYSYIAMPVRINYFIGKEIKFTIGAGLVPQMFSGYKQEIQWTTSKEVKESETVETKMGFNSFILSSIISAGVQLKMQKNWMLYVSPEVRIQLTSSYEKQADYIHKNRAYGLTFGLIRNL